MRLLFNCTETTVIPIVVKSGDLAVSVGVEGKSELTVWCDPATATLDAIACNSATQLSAKIIAGY